MVTMPGTSNANGGKHPVELGAVQETLFVPLAARARETAKRRPLLRDPKAVEMIDEIDYPVEKYGPGPGSSITVLRTAIVDHWVRAFLAEHPAGTVVEIGTGLNTRFERVDNGTVHWVDLDLPDTIALRRRYFTDSERRRTVAASVLDEEWLRTVEEGPGPYFFVAEGVLVYLPEDEAARALTRIAQRFPGALVALDTYPQRLLEKQHEQAVRKEMEARWAWSCEDPRSLEKLGMSVVEAASVTRPPRAFRAGLPLRFRLLLPLADRLLHGMFNLTLFRAGER
ncbi:O-methyltransferase involved in polyketide biosynthesis [Streptomyces sp. VMFN-G11Ma]|jgi:O-methyltransferase involved in polyketide biosynthesis|nr:O-methyltransferase involved in polyketide biosynthesis [Streptomyces sp. VMFN-G11Ma]